MGAGGSKTDAGSATQTPQPAAAEAPPPPAGSPGPSFSAAVPSPTVSTVPPQRKEEEVTAELERMSTPRLMAVAERELASGYSAEDEEVERLVAEELKGCGSDVRRRALRCAVACTPVSRTSLSSGRLLLGDAGGGAALAARRIGRSRRRRLAAGAAPAPLGPRHPPAQRPSLDPHPPSPRPHHHPRPASPLLRALAPLLRAPHSRACRRWCARPRRDTTRNRARLRPRASLASAQTPPRAPRQTGAAAKYLQEEPQGAMKLDANDEALIAEIAMQND